MSIVFEKFFREILHKFAALALCRIATQILAYNTKNFLPIVGELWDKLPTEFLPNFGNALPL
jgi:hypothetical protein